MTASGTFGSGLEYSEFVDLSRLGAVVTKGVSAVAWEGNETPRLAETPSGMLNAIGLQNPGAEVFVERDLPFLQQYDTRIIVNVCGKTVEDYLAVVERLADTAVDLLEINVSCPNVKAGALAFGQDALEFILAGASAVAVGTMNFHNPAVTIEIIEGLAAYLEKHQIDDINTLRGAVA
jgi:dihydroorotate dehydrogenase (NAD+) catalytic subunit